MAATDQITIILADEDALRRDGLAAVLEGAGQFEILEKCPDGEAALAAIRDRHPDVAVVDLNLPGLHGIELVRRVRSESLRTRIVIMSGTTDEEIVREVVRAGADAYLLKNGPARHLIDAINYVRDGGQYFSPQLHRDGRDRHLLEEPPRSIHDAPPPRREQRPEERREDHDRGADDDRRSAGSRSPRGPARRVDARERLHEEARRENLQDRDYEILDMMAEGIRPILDRLEDIEGRIIEMEDGDQPVPSDVRGWLNSQIADTLEVPRAGGGGRAAQRSMQDLEAHLPQMIEQAVNSRFQQMAGKLQKEIEDTHLRTLETFVKNIQVKLVSRVAALETDMTKQADAMKQLREYSARTEDNLSRLITGVDKLAQDLPRRLEAGRISVEGEPITDSPAASARLLKRKPSSRNFKVKIFWGGLAVVVVLIVGVLMLRKPSSDTTSGSGSAATADTGASSSSGSSKPAVAKPSAGADTKTKMAAAQEYVDRKEYPTAEDIYRQVVRTEPNNVEALKALASVLYREDKLDESAAILDKLPKN